MGNLCKNINDLRELMFMLKCIYKFFGYKFFF